MLKYIKVNKTDLFYEDKWNNSNLNEYYQYILNKLIDFFYINNIELSVNFGCDFLNKDIDIDFQYEHTIIKNNNDYSCRIFRFENLIKCDLVFDYSNANIAHIKNYPEYDEYINICRYYPPLLYDIMENNDANRIKNCLTIHNPSPRRNKIHEKIDMDYYNTLCGDNLYDKTIMKNVMDNYKLLINIHQTDIHYTLEELRVLPSLMSGMLIVSEDVPYKEHIPYSKHIIWSSYNDLNKTINDVLHNYDLFKKQYLTDLSKTLFDMKLNSDDILNNFFTKKLFGNSLINYDKN